MVRTAMGDKTARALVVGFLVAIVLGLVIQHVPALVGWKTPDGDLSVSQLHALCTSPLGQEAARLEGPTARCTSDQSYYRFTGFLFLAGIVCAGCAAWRVIRGRKAVRAQEG